MKKISFLLVLLPALCFGQLHPHAQQTFDIQSEGVWHADLLGNLYIADKDLLMKYDTAGNKQYSQSIKSLGSITSISSINTMRIVLFSEQQQSFTLMDNTLSESNQTYDLSALDFGYVSKMAVSSQPNKFWIYDQSNSRLVFLDLSRTQQQQEIENFRGLLNASEVIWMKEDNNQLYLFDSNDKLYTFDRYGSLLDVVDFPEIKGIEVFKNEIFVLRNEKLYRYRAEDQSFEEVQMSPTEIQSFQWTNSTFFIRSKNQLLKFGLVSR